MTVRDKLAAIKQSPVTTELMPALINAGTLATVAGYTSAMATAVGSNIAQGETLFDTVKDGNKTTSEKMNRLNDGINLRLYRVDEARILVKTQGLLPVEELIPICFCPTFAFTKDPSVGEQSIDDQRENLRLATLAIYTMKNFPDRPGVYRVTQPEIVDRIPMSVQNYIMEFENKKKVSEGDNWYSAPFTICFSVVIKNFI